jgi:sugar lactone lactonase YvrE
MPMSETPYVAVGAGSHGLRVVSTERDQLGEGPVWDDREAVLLRVDIARGLVLTMREPGEASSVMRIDGEVSAVVLRDSGGLLLAVGHELIALDARGDFRTVAIVEEDEPENRFNDCRCDPRGRLWAGTMNKSGTPGAAGLYRMAVGRRLELVIPDTTVSNGIGWSPRGETMYFVDSTTQRIDAFDFDLETGSITNRRTFASVDPNDGLPDGLTVDAEGGVWLCLFGGAAVRRYSADGRLDEVISLPVTNPTCPSFGGPGLETLHITTARHRLSTTQLAGEPLAGALLALEPGVAGVPATRFAS